MRQIDRQQILMSQGWSVYFSMGEGENWSDSGRRTGERREIGLKVRRLVKRGIVIRVRGAYTSARRLIRVRIFALNNDRHREEAMARWKAEALPGGESD